jgi:hypothetical protein
MNESRYILSNPGTSWFRQHSRRARWNMSAAVRFGASSLDSRQFCRDLKTRPQRQSDLLPPVGGQGRRQGFLLVQTTLPSCKLEYVGSRPFWRQFSRFPTILSGSKDPTEAPVRPPPSGRRSGQTPRVPPGSDKRPSTQATNSGTSSLIPVHPGSNHHHRRRSLISRQQPALAPVLMIPDDSVGI